MSVSSNRRERVTQATAKARVLLKTRASLILSLVLLILSVVYLSYQAIRAATMIDVWIGLKAREAGTNAIDEALRVVNREELALIPPIALTAVFSVTVFRSVSFKIIPQKCFYCGEWVQAKKAKQAPDKAFFYHEECELNEGKRSNLLFAHEVSAKRASF